VSLTCLAANVSLRADVESAVDFVTPPLLPPSERVVETLVPSFASNPSLNTVNLPVRLFLFQIDPKLSETARSIIHLSNTIDDALINQRPLDPDHIDQEAIFIQRSLLVCNAIDFTAFDSAFRLAAMIYVKSITRPVEMISRTSQRLIGNLQKQLILVDEPSTPLLRWMYFMGSLASLEGSVERSWFLQVLPMCKWSELRKDLRDILWVGEIHDCFGEALWSAR
jgi:hypothetical protein